MFERLLLNLRHAGGTELVSTEAEGRSGVGGSAAKSEMRKNERGELELESRELDAKRQWEISRGMKLNQASQTLGRKFHIPEGAPTCTRGR